jgi:hypothetical protein
VPSNLVLARVGAPTWLAVLMGCWGVVDAAQAAIRSPAHFYILRFLLGLAECGAFPGTPLTPQASCFLSYPPPPCVFPPACARLCVHAWICACACASVFGSDGWKADGKETGGLPRQRVSTTTEGGGGLVQGFHVASSLSEGFICPRPFRGFPCAPFPFQGFHVAPSLEKLVPGEGLCGM